MAQGDRQSDEVASPELHGAVSVEGKPRDTASNQFQQAQTPLGSPQRKGHSDRDSKSDELTKAQFGLSFAVITYGLAIWLSLWKNELLVADYLIVGGIGVATGATELLARFKDKPFDALGSIPGIYYMLINAGAAALGFFILLKWNYFADDPVKRVMVAGISAMAIFRSGMFTTKVGEQEIPFGPSLILKIILDVLDRTYDRQRANRRAGLIADLMGGIDFEQARKSLPVVCAKLMQNVSNEEREKLDASFKELAEDKDLLDEAKSMALGLTLMNVVGEDTLKAATNNLGSNIFGFRSLPPGITDEIALRDADDIIQNLYRLCNNLAHKRAQLEEVHVLSAERAINRLHLLCPEARAFLMTYSTCRQYGDALLSVAIKMLKAKTNPAPPAVPAAP